MSKKHRRTKVKRTKRVKDNKTHKCPNCGEKGSHFVPPSLGEEGFFSCTKVIMDDVVGEPNVEVKEGNKLEVLQCVDCPKDKAMVLLTECEQCSNRLHGNCLFDGTKPIRVVGLGTPHRFNRDMSEGLGIQERDIALNYYSLTKIMLPVRSISKEKYPNFHEVKKRFAQGKYSKKDEVEKEMVTIKPLLSLIQTEGLTDNDLLLGGQRYKVTDREFTGEFEVVYYLYDVYTLEGFGDLCINGKFYRVSMSKIDNTKADLVLGRRGTYIVIGEVVKGGADEGNNS